MCARFNLTSSDQVARYFQGRLVFEEPPRYNIAPSDVVLAAVAFHEHGMKLEPQRWGVHMGHRPQPVINFRSESSMLEKTLDAGSRYARCLIPATGFFEWRTEGGVKQPYNFMMKDREAFAFAGLFVEGKEGPPECAILTCEPNELVAEYHDRMPSIIAPDRADAWLFSDETDEVLFLARVPFPADRMAAFPVTRKMGNPRYQEAASVVQAEPENPTLF